MMENNKFSRILFSYWKKELLILISAGLSMLFSLIIPYLAKIIIDEAYKNRDLKLLAILTITGFIVFVLIAGLNSLNDYLSSFVRIHINFKLNRIVFSKLQSLSYKFFQDRVTGGHLYRISHDIEQLTHYIVEVLPQFIVIISRSLLILGVIFYLQPKIALFYLALMPFSYFTPLYFTKKLKKAFNIWVEKTQEIFNKLQEVLSRMYLVKIFGKGKFEELIYTRSITDNLRFSLQRARLEASGNFVNNLVGKVILGLVIFYGGYQIIEGRMSLGDLSAVTIYLSQLSGLHGSWGSFFQQVSFGEVSYNRLNDILKAEPELEKTLSGKETTIINGGIKFKDVSFGYYSNRLVFDNLNFFIPAGSRIALVGSSGCGKTTIVNLILGLYSPLRGKIVIGEEEVRGGEPKFLYKYISVAPQEPFLWNDTVEANIRYGKEKATVEEVIEASKVAYADEFISDLSKGYQTIIGENACRLSEGQKQRISISRAVIKRPKILILDEALSSVEEGVEEIILGNVRKFLHDSTIIVITHRASTIGKMEMVYFFNSCGRVQIKPVALGKLN